ncbi:MULTISPECIES: Yip1 family protein [Metallibacterium]|jgi:hypothetical protein|uniref:Yip1 family protein n=1 Tax=Metallibacterium TaxID=1218803 RepID=UPI0026326109|nr:MULTISPECIES: Yip1 family protein [Metallibacterium]MBW8074088.1 DUF1282 domain-containing protein [Metallibacterium scheffleri]
MDFARLLERARAIVLNPRATWPVIAAETDSIGGLYRDWILWLSAVTPLATFIGLAVFGLRLPFIGSLRVGVGTLLTQMLLQYALTLLIVFVLALIAAALAPSFGGRNQRVAALKAIAYAWTPVWVVGVLNLIPLLGPLTALLSLAALGYGAWLLYLGAQATLGVPQERAAGYTAVIIVIGFVLALVMGMLTATLSGMGALARGGTEVSMHTPTGTAAVSVMSQKFEQAARQMQATGDAMQGKAPAPDLAPIKPLAPRQLEALLPAGLPGRARGAVSASRNGVGALLIGQASADYGSGSDAIRLGIVDMGANRAMLTLAGMVQTDEHSASGYDKVFQQGGRTVHEQWNAAAKHGEYSVIVGGRFVVKAEGAGVGMDALQQAVDAVDLAQLDRLKDTPGQ